MRLNKFLAQSGLTSRRKADKLIASGKITVNGKNVNQPFFCVKNSDTVEINNQRVSIFAKKIYLLINKPKGVTTTCSDKFAKTTILDLIPKKIFSKEIKVYPAGRLDKNSTGLVILTNDGNFCYNITHPKFEIEKEYIVELSRELKKADLKKAKTGVHDQGQTLKLKAITKNEEKIARCSKFNVIITEGKKRHIRRLFNQLGYKVKNLKRIRIGKFTLGNLREGEYRVISQIKIKKYLNEKN